MLRMKSKFPNAHIHLSRHVFTTMGSRAPVSQRWDLTRLTPQPCFCSELNLMACPVLVNLSQNPLTVITFLWYSLTSLPWSDFRLWICPVYLVQGCSDFSTSLPDSFSIFLLSCFLEKVRKANKPLLFPSCLLSKWWEVAVIPFPALLMTQASFLSTCLNTLVWSFLPRMYLVWRLHASWTWFSPYHGKKK